MLVFALSNLALRATISVRSSPCLTPSCVTYSKSLFLLFFLVLTSDLDRFQRGPTVFCFPDDLLDEVGCFFWSVGSSWNVFLLFQVFTGGGSLMFNCLKHLRIFVLAEPGEFSDSRLFSFCLSSNGSRSFPLSFSLRPDKRPQTRLTTTRQKNELLKKSRLIPGDER